MFGVDANGSGSAHESGSGEESNDSSGRFSANAPSTCKTVAQHVLFRVHNLQKRYSKKVAWSIQKCTPNELKLKITEVSSHSSCSMSNLKTLCSTRQVIAF